MTGRSLDDLHSELDKQSQARMKQMMADKEKKAVFGMMQSRKLLGFGKRRREKASPHGEIPPIPSYKGKGK